MNYPMHNHHVIVQPITKSNNSKSIIYLSIFLSIFLSIIIIGIGLGVGLGIGLRSKSKSSATNEYGILSAPIVNCTYINSSTCGCAAIKPTFLSSRIINGYTSVAHSWPWTVIIYYNNARQCDGFLITYEHVITAAHCVFDFKISLFEIYAGIHSLSSSSSSTDKQIRRVSQIKIHPDYSSITLLNDIAIIKLSNSLIPSTTIGLCCLSSDNTLPRENESAVIVGWGRTRATDSSSLSDTLQQAVIKIQSSTTTCNVNSNSYRQFCAGYGSSDSCQGDSGSPLMTSVNNLWTCTGIVSYGVSCGDGGYYTRVSYYKSFIDNTILTL